MSNIGVGIREKRPHNIRVPYIFVPLKFTDAECVASVWDNSAEMKPRLKTTTMMGPNLSQLGQGADYYCYYNYSCSSSAKV